MALAEMGRYRGFSVFSIVMLTDTPSSVYIKVSQVSWRMSLLRRPQRQANMKARFSNSYFVSSLMNA